MSKIVSQFSSSANEIIKSYTTPLDKYYFKCKKKLSREKSEVSFDKQPWTTFRITMLCSVLSNMDLFKYLVEIGFIFNKISSVCKNCDGKLNLILSSTAIDGVVYKCSNTILAENSKIKKKCDKKFSVRGHSWFSGSHLKIHEILTLTYYWWNNLSLNFIEQDLDLAHSTLIDWANFCREVAEDIVINNSEKIGGTGIIVEIDESKFGKRKYHRGKRVEGVWVFGGVERRTGKCFLVVVPDRTANTLLTLIQEWILPGTTIISDCWKSYDKIEEHNNYKHLTVNHSVTFKDPDSGAHTNQIEGLWCLAKKSLPSTNRSKKMFGGYLAAFMLHTKWKGKDAFAMFMRYAALLYGNEEQSVKVVQEVVSGKKRRIDK